MPPPRRYDVLSAPAVYALTCDGVDIYVGGTKDAYGRIYNHLWRLDKGCHKSPSVQKLYDDKPKGSFGFRIIEYVEEKDIREREKYWTARTPNLLSAMPLGLKHAPDTLARKSERARRQMQDPAQRAAVIARLAENSKKIAERRRNDPEFAKKAYEAGLRGSQRLKELWKDPGYRAKHYSKYRESALYMTSQRKCFQRS